MQCTASPNPFAQILSRAMFSTMAAELPPVTVILYTSGYPSHVGFRIDAVRVSNGTFVSIQDMSRHGVGGGTEIHVTVAPASATAQIVVDVDVGCGDAVATKRYRVYYQVPASPGGLVVVAEEPASPVDAGTD